MVSVCLSTAEYSGVSHVSDDKIPLAAPGCICPLIHFSSSCSVVSIVKPLVQCRACVSDKSKETGASTCGAVVGVSSKCFGFTSLAHSSEGMRRGLRQEQRSEQRRRQRRRSGNRYKGADAAASKRGGRVEQCGAAQARQDRAGAAPIGTHAPLIIAHLPSVSA